MTSTLETITPDKAIAYLAKSTGNRPIIQRSVTELYAAIKTGKWRVTPNGIGFDVNGRLIDGHHRLTAITQAGLPVQSWVTRGLDPESWFAIDGGRRRSLGVRSNVGNATAGHVQFVWKTIMVWQAYDTPADTVLAVSKHPFFETAAALGEGVATTKFGAIPYRVGAAYAIHAMHRDREWVEAQYRHFVQADAAAAHAEVGLMVNDIFRGVIVANMSADRARGFVRSAITFGKLEHPKLTSSLVARTLDKAREYFRPIFDAAENQLSSPVA
jgi:hypothetical protein